MRGLRRMQSRVKKTRPLTNNKERERKMVPTFGMFDFMPERLGRAQVEDSEREAYLSEVNRQSTQFGASVGIESQAHIDACVRMALLLNRF